MIAIMNPKPTWREEYKRLYKEHITRKYPSFPPIEPKIPTDRTANGLTQLIIKFLAWKGHYANRISTQGQARADGGRIKWTTSHTKRGTPDITAIISGRSVWIEVKVGKDHLSDAQVKQQSDIQEAGGIYYVARDMQSFYQWYYWFIVTDKKLLDDPDLYTTLD
jgi:hypothetical protein